jgi:hypothetical protein
MSASVGERETPRWASCFPIAALAAWAILRIGTWFGRDYTHDDFYFAYASWLRAIKARPGVDTDGALYTPLVELFAPAFRAWPESFFALDLGRAFILVVALLLLGAVYRTARILGAAIPWALAATSIVAWQGDFLLRSSDVRTDPIATLFFLSSMLLVLREERIPFFGAGLCYGSAVFFSVKFGVAVPALALAVGVAARKAPLRALLRYAAGGAAATLLWQGLRALSDGWGPIVAGFRSLVGSPPGLGAPPSSEFFRRAVQVAPISSTLLVLGTIGSLALPLLLWARRQPVSDLDTRRMIYSGASILFLASFLRANPFLFPYNFVILMPILGPLLCGLPRLLPAGMSPMARAILLALAVIAPVSEGVEAFSATLGRTNVAQRRVLQWIWNATEPSEHVFDWQGMHWGRRGTYHWWMFSGWVPAYRTGSMYSVADELEASQVTLVIDNYRLGWFQARDQEFFRSHYVRLDYCLFVPGRTFLPEEVRDGSAFDLVVPGFFRIDPSDAAAGVSIDGVPAAPILNLSAGLHHLASAPGRSRNGFRLVLSSPRRERFALPCPAPETLYGGF